MSSVFVDQLDLKLGTSERGFCHTQTLHVHVQRHESVIDVAVTHAER